MLVQVLVADIAPRLNITV